MWERFGKLALLLKPTPARAYLLGTGVMLMLPDSAFKWLSLQYHEFSVDTTYLLEDTPQADVKPIQAPSSLQKNSDQPSK